MKFLKRTGIVLLALIVVLLIVAVLMPSHVHIEKKKVINAPTENIFYQVGNLRNWDRWSPWNQMDPAWKVTYNGPQFGEGASYSWQSNMSKVGNGTVTVTKFAPFDSVVCSLDFMNNGKPAWSKYYFKKTPAGTEVTLVFDADFGWNLIARLFSPMIKNEVNTNYDTALENIRKICEDEPKDTASGKFTPYISSQPEQDYYSIRDTASMATILQKFNTNFMQIMIALQKTGVKGLGSPFANFYSRDNGVFDIEWGIYTDKAGPGDGNVKPAKQHAAQTVAADYYGPYLGVSASFKSIADFAAGKKMQLDSPVHETYITDPTGADFSKVLTVVNYCVKSDGL